MKIGVTGHQELDNPEWVKQELLRLIQVQSLPVIGVTSLAIGTDQIFAQLILDCAGSLHVIVPCKEYIKTFEPEEREEYKRLLSRATSKEELPAETCSERAYFSAGKKVVEISDLIFVVWNGKPAAGLGGTGDIVEYTKLQGKNYIHLNPATREIFSFTR